MFVYFNILLFYFASNKYYNTGINEIQYGNNHTNLSCEVTQKFKYENQ